MKRILYTGLILISVALIQACDTYSYYKAGATKLNTSQYHTFAWIADPGQSNPKPDKGGKPYAGNAYYNNPQATQAIRTAALFNLQTKGLRIDEQTPDLLVHYTSAVGRGTRLDYYTAYPYYWGGAFYRPYWGYRPYWYGGFPYYGGGTYAVPETYKEGTIIIDLIDRKSNKIIWRGFGVGELHHDPQKTIEELPKVVEGIFKQLPTTM
ncbi:DUF4136 domain-containing protein [Mucilaginibacter ginkgonis]|uniref:DUF4136 domain-containing protein n=1 Tax=Mucilaginibacter ginkgonis TaxID=2682091 RepID=A0A6I4HUV9_9SPHI|nr:DUF4136 domain-containing protein [Mucilaginibacter ginkgonis]QQL50088.1 DUF4136 domain-containing protein [Mucilaginibacter ginkgonis]